MAYAEDRGDGADPQPGAASDVDDLEAEAASDLTDAELPAFLIEGDEAGVALNGALRRPDAHFRSGDRAPAGAGYLCFIPSFADWIARGPSPAVDGARWPPRRPACC